MKALDTNVLVRYLVQDDPQQSRLAADYILTHCTEETPAYIHHVVLCELVWVLESAYGYERELGADVVEKIFRTREFYIDAMSVAWAALHCYRDRKTDFADGMIGMGNHFAGCDKTATFDKKAAKLDVFEELR